MAGVIFKQPVQIGGQEAIVINDVVGNITAATQDISMYVQTFRGTDDTPSIFTYQQDVRDLRENHPSTPVFGIWQLAFANKLIDWEYDAYVIETDRNTGPIIYRENRSGLIDEAVVTGQMNDGYCAAIAGLPEDRIKILKVDLDTLTLPQEAIRTVEEIRKDKDIAKRKNQLHGATAFAGVVGAITLASFFSVQMHHSKAKDIAMKSSEIANLHEKIDNLKRTRITSIPNYSERILQLGSLYLVDPKISTVESADEGVKGFPSEYIELKTSPGYPYDPSIKFKWAKSKRGPLNEWIIRI